LALASSYSSGGSIGLTKQCSEWSTGKFKNKAISHWQQQAATAVEVMVLRCTVIAMTDAISLGCNKQLLVDSCQDLHVNLGLSTFLCLPIF